MRRERNTSVTTTTQYHPPQLHAFPFARFRTLFSVEPPLLKLRRLIPFLLMVLIPLGLIAYLGVALTKQEQAKSNQQLEVLLDQQLNEIDRVFRATLDAIESELLDSYEAASFQPSAVQSPLVLESFKTDATGNLVSPSAGTPDQSEQQFLNRTESIWNSGLRFAAEIENSTVSRPTPRQESLLGSRNARATPAIVADVSISKTGWHTWFYDSDTHFLHWQELANGEVIGGEINRPALIGRLIGALFASDALPGARITLRSATGQTLHQWGDYGPSRDEVPLLTLALSAPLSSWQLAYFSDALPQSQGKLSRSVWLNLLGLTLAFLIIAIWCFRENGRAQREAARRVSFVNQVSHELKTPLTNIRLYTEMAAADLHESDTSASQSLDVVTEESKRLSRLISNVLSFARAERNQLQVSLKKVDLAEAVALSQRNWAPALTRAGVALEVQQTEPLFVKADPDALEQILSNLFSNLEKYAAKSGTANLTISRNGQTAKLDLIDAGPGIPVRSRKRIFQPFTRLRSSLHEGAAGTGIGLSIARDLAEAMSGELTLVSSQKGAHFQLTLPLAHD